MHSFIYQCWFNKHPLRWLLLPLTLLFFLLSSFRKLLFSSGVKKASHPGVPVVVVGNISVGGNGKTPLVLKTIEWLIDLGYKPGILSRGYGGTCEDFPHKVMEQDTASLIGDEPKLMSLRNLCPVIIDPKRARGAKALANVGCNVIVCDDGLQHYGLKRDIEWVVMDNRGVGNGWLLPMGPLRELAGRLKHVDAVIHNGDKPYVENAYSMSLATTRFVNIVDTNITRSIEEFVSGVKQEKLHAMAGIGAPQRFFDTLSSIGLNGIETHEFIDHHVYTKSDIPSGVTVMTEKDAVKCKSFAHSNCWYLEVDAKLPRALKENLAIKLRDCYGV